MRIKELIKGDAGFQYVIDSMELMSAAGRRKMLDTEFSTDAAWLEAEWNRLDEAIGAVREYKYKKPYIDLRHCLMQLHDLKGTLASLANHTPLNEVELFEVKSLAQLCRTATGAIEGLGMTAMLPLPSTDEAFALLDPDHTGIANFYIYDSYDPRLAPLRRELSAMQMAGNDPERIAALLAEQNEIQNEVCVRLSDKLVPWAPTLSEALEQMAYADLLFAKAELAIAWNLTRPVIGERIEYKALVNPRLKQRNEATGLRYQPVDITIGGGVTLITGANMAGKTVLLKSIGSAQMMMQCGFHAPAEKVETILFDGVATSIGDDQDEMNGLSSYAAEIIKISDIVRRCRTEHLLVLIDEPARTTNPTEGKAIVQAVIELMQKVSSATLITTHYGQLGGDCRKLRVRGFVEDMSDMPLNPRNINLFIDYSLTEDSSGEVPHEALRIASILGCDKELIDKASNYVSR
ncbi:MAG: DNA mismatch repair protein MutS [Bacteroidales bacterium]|nr:DNA mismatch repair protein MutS [Bacteroidales bacterium]